MPVTPRSPYFVDPRRVQPLRDALLDWFSRHGIGYPWRHPSVDPFRLVVTECLLQRTRAETVARHWHRFFTGVPDWEALVTMDPERLTGLLTPFGLTRTRCRSLRALALEVLDLGGELPGDPRALMELPGVGHYIANAVRLLIFDERVPLLDVNFARVTERLYGPRRMADIRHDPKLLYLADCIVDSPRARELNWAILDLAKKTCITGNPRCSACPVSGFCFFYQHSAGKH